MATLVSMGLAVSTLLVLGYIVGTELCLPTARHALHTGDMEAWWLACRLVAAGEWAIIVLCASFLLLVEYAWHLFTAITAGKILGLAAAGLVTAAVLWEVAGHSRKHHARIMSTSLDLVLPPHGIQRERYTRLQQRLETGSRAEQRRILQSLVVRHHAPGT